MEGHALGRGAVFVCNRLSCLYNLYDQVQTRSALSHLPSLHLLPVLSLSRGKDRGGAPTCLGERLRQLPPVENKHNKTIEV